MSTPPIQFRMAGGGDADALATLRWRLFVETHPALSFAEGGQEMAEFQASMHAMLQDACWQHFVATQADQPIAVMSVYRVPKLPTPLHMQGCWGYLTNVYTLPTYRNQGVGRSLLTTVQRWAATMGMELLLVWPSEAARTFYQRAGFAADCDPLVHPILNEEG